MAKPTPTSAPAVPAPSLSHAPQVAQVSLLRHIGLDGDLITLTEAARRLPRIDGRKVAVPALWRWCRRGLRGVFLEYTRVGRTICTSRYALARFFAALSALDRQTPPPGRPEFLGKRPLTSKQRLRALQEADRILEAAKI